MRKKIRHILFIVTYFLGITRLFYWLNRRKQRIIVFHHIIPDDLLNGSFEQQIVCSSQSKFYQLLKIINNHFRVTTELGLPGTAIITFDDGYRAALVAEQELDRFDNKAYFFIPTSNVGSGPLWVDRVMAWFAYCPDGTYCIQGVNYSLSSDKSRRKAFSSFMDTIYDSPERYDLSFAEYFDFDSLLIDSKYKILRFNGLTNEEIDGLKQRGHMIGGHSVRHDILSLLSEDDLKKDFRECSDEIDKLYNCKVYAYPYGHPRDVSELCIAECQKSGFNNAVMNECVPDESPYKLSRINISGYSSRYEVEAALSGLTQWLKNMFRWIK